MSGMNVNVIGVARGASITNAPLRDDRAANAEPGDGFAAALDQKAAEPAPESSQASQTPSDQKNTKTADFSDDAQLSLGNGDWVEALLNLSGAQGSAQEKPAKAAAAGADMATLNKAKNLDAPRPPAADAKALAYDKRNDAFDRASRAAGVSLLTTDADKGDPTRDARKLTSLTSERRDAAPESMKLKDPPAPTLTDGRSNLAPSAANVDAVSAAAALAIASPAYAADGSVGVKSGADTAAALGRSEDRDVHGARSGAASTAHNAPPAEARFARDEQTAGDSVAGTRAKVFVTSEATWLAPVRPESGLPRVARDDSPDSAAGARPVAAEVQAPQVKIDAPAQIDAAAVSHSEHAMAPAPANEARTPPSAISAREAAPAPAPRRDLEVILAPNDLGGLALRLKSFGDRLEIAFVADKGDTAHMIGDRSATLESQLRDAGLGPGGVTISVTAKPDASAGQSNSSQGAPQEGQQQRDATPQRQHVFGRNRQDFTDENLGKTSEPCGGHGDRGLYL